ncbi:hypothetical protein DDZ14_04830 [Maritimibacter sp. 55A14]|nr:hypothetical protein DDZ14_04830 [Maritimibacter sp. 55A14]
MPTLWREDGRSGDLDCETAALLRAHVLREFALADSWTSLADSLAAKGLRLGFRAGHMVLIHRGSEAVLCTGRFLGVPLTELAARLGRPVLRIVDDAAAELRLHCYRTRRARTGSRSENN